MSICFVIDKTTNIVVNKIVADPTDLSPEGTFLVELVGSVQADIGWTFNEGVFTPPLLDEELF